MFVDHGPPPSLTTSIYQSYTWDPPYQTRFTAMWLVALGACIFIAVLRGSLRKDNLKNAATALRGIRVRGLYETVPDSLEGELPEKRPKVDARPTRKLVRFGRALNALRLWSLPGLDLNTGQIFIVAAYAAFTLVCIVVHVPLFENPNRAGFIALAQLPPVFLFAAKNSPLTTFLLGPGIDYAKLNFIHRWSGRSLFLSALIHGALWIRNRIVYGLPILTRHKEGSGVAVFTILCVIVVSSVSPLRRYWYSAFLVIHYLTFPAFLIIISWHTMYAVPWVFPPLALYGADLFLRFIRWRVVAGRIEARGQGSAALSLVIRIPPAAGGWQAGQHVQVRVVFGRRTLESHPLTICCAPPGQSCLTGPDGAPLGMLLGVRACGDWSRSLHRWALQPDFVLDPEGDVEAQAMQKLVGEEEQELAGRDIRLVLEGPHGGPTLRPDDYESVLMFAGGSGVTFTLGVLDGLVARAVPLGTPLAPQPTTTRVVWCWCVRSFGAINWFAPQLLQIATRAAHPASPLRLRIRIFVTCLCDPEAVPRIPGSTVTEARPSVKDVLATLLDPQVVDEFDCCCSPAADSERSSIDEASTSEVRTTRTPAVSHTEGEEEQALVLGDRTRRQPHAGVAVFAAGPSSLIREASNATASANLSAVGMRAGGVELCAETFTV